MRAERCEHLQVNLVPVQVQDWESKWDFGNTPSPSEHDLCARWALGFAMETGVDLSTAAKNNNNNYILDMYTKDIKTRLITSSNIPLIYICQMLGFPSGPVELWLKNIIFER